MARSSIMAIGSHPDDIEIMAMPGILAGVRAGGNRFFGVVATNGGGLKRTGDYSGFTYLETREVRRAEQNRQLNVASILLLSCWAMIARNGKIRMMNGHMLIWYN